MGVNQISQTKSVVKEYWAPFRELHHFCNTLPLAYSIYKAAFLCGSFFFLLSFSHRIFKYGIFLLSYLKLKIRSSLKLFVFFFKDESRLFLSQISYCVRACSD